MKLNKRGNWGLISLLAAAAITMVLASMYFGGYIGGSATVGRDSSLLDKSSKKQTIVGKSLDTAKGVDCRTRLQQIRAGIVNEKTVSGTEENPRSLKDVHLGVSTDYFYCPVSHQPYIYDPATGLVHCQNPGHERF